jgi:hypothetical protein
MTPKEKAFQLVIDKYYHLNCISKIEYAKRCALIAIDEVLFVLNEIDSTEQWNASWFYNEVKQEIEKL